MYISIFMTAFLLTKIYEGGGYNFRVDERCGRSVEKGGGYIVNDRYYICIYLSSNLPFGFNR